MAPSRVEPGTVAEAAAEVERARAAGLRVSIERGDGDVVLSTRRLDRVLEHEAGDLTATVEAGIRLSALAARLAQAGQMLALDPPGDPTVGACVAANLSGPRRHRYGAPRDLVLGVTAVLADGTIASSGGKVVKNVAGYDLSKLFCGSTGTLGLIARVSVRLHPCPQAQRTLAVDVASAADATRLALAIRLSTLEPSAVDLLWRAGGGSRLLVLFEGSAAGAAAQLAAARELLGGDEADASVWEETRAWQSRAGGRLSFAPGDLESLLQDRAEALVRPGVGCAYVPEPVPDPSDPAALRLLERVRAAFDQRGTWA
ncbi:MAG: FAD-binding oxidoreductase [Thermoleophilia bacterium]|nr:FAD-binding oxidoreductase [Thermoleophilia bacterium]